MLSKTQMKFIFILCVVGIVSYIVFESVKINENYKVESYENDELNPFSEDRYDSDYS